MATQHVSTWRDEYADLSYLYIPDNPAGAFTAVGGNLSIDMSKSNSSAFIYERMNTANSNVSETATNYSSTSIYGGTGTAGSGETSQSAIQSFTAVSTNVYAVGVYFNVRTGTPTDNITVTLSDALTGGTALATRSLAASSITLAAETMFVFGDTTITPGNTYYVEITRSGARDTANFMGVDYNTAATYAGGGLFRRGEGTATSAGATSDARFRVIGLDTFDMTGSKEFFWEHDMANSSISPNKVLLSFVVELFDKTNGTYSQTYSPALTVNVGDVYWRATFSGSTVVVYSSSNNSTWTSRWTGPSLNATKLQGVVVRRSYSSTTTTDVLQTKYFSLGTQQTVVTQGIKYWNGTAWVAKPVKYWDGTAWIQKPAKRWDGTAWITPPY